MLKNKAVSLQNKLETLRQKHAKMRNNGNLPGQLADDEKRSLEEEDPRQVGQQQMVRMPESFLQPEN